MREFRSSLPLLSLQCFLGFCLRVCAFFTPLAAQSPPAQEKRSEELKAQVEQLFRQGKFAEATPLAQEWLRIAEETSGLESVNVASPLDYLATLDCQQGRYAEAEPLFKRALATYEMALGPHHPEVAWSLNNLAALYNDEGHYAKAELLYKRALAILEKALGPEHPDVATSLNDLAVLYENQRRYSEAAPLYKRALAIREKALGPEHPDVAKSLNNLVALYRKQGRHAEAEPLYQRAQAIYEKTLGPGHIEGTIRDATGAAVQGAQVELRAKGFSATTRTNASGAFAFDHVPENSGTIAIVAKGFEKAEQEWNAASSGVARIEIVLAPMPIHQQVIVTAARTPTRLSDSPQSDIQLTREDVQATPALTLDDSLRQVPGFSLFRRSSSRTANPTTQGVSLRGLGSSGASRVLVLEDDIPLNDPFGAWVYWDRVPAESVVSVDVAQEGASTLYGSDALGGVLAFRTRATQPAGISLETSYGNQNTPDLSISAGGQAGRWESTFGGEVFHTDGYILVPTADRGSVDTKAGSEHDTADLMVGKKIGAASEVFARGWYFDETRNNGTPLQTNDTRIGEGALGANLQLGDIGALTLRFYGEGKTYHQSLSSIATSRNSETLTDLQRVPAQETGGSAVWSRAAGKRQTLVAGFDEHEEIGRSNEMLFSAGGNSSDVSAGGRQRTTGVFGEDLIQVAPHWLVAASARSDNWRNFDASTVCTPITPLCPQSSATYADRSENAFSPRLSIVNQVDPHVSWSAAIDRAFRAPTLNELYRSFRQGNVFTESNADLRAERLTGGEAGVDVNGFNHRLEVRGTFFFNEIINPVANVTLATTPTLITRQRENLGRTNAPGFEIDAAAHITNRLQLSGGYQYVDATVASSPGLVPSLVGRWIAQVPHNVLTFQAHYTYPSRISVSVNGRMAGMQFDDDLNQYPLGRYFVLDVMASREFARGVELFAAVENLFNEQYSTAATPVPQLGLPIAARFGLHVQFPRR